MNRPAQIPAGLQPYFQKYDPSRLNLEKDADLIIQRGLEFGTWEEVRWLFATYGSGRIRLFLRDRGERMLPPVAFHYWRKLMKVVRWRRSPWPTMKRFLERQALEAGRKRLGELWE